MLVAQITDLHLGFDPDDPNEFNRERADRVLAVLAALDPSPELLLVTGDIADNGDDADAYQRYRDAIQGLPFPVYPAMGNHDNRDAFLAAFPDTPNEGGFIHYAIEDHALRILVLDTLEPGRHGGNFCSHRADWLTARLDEAPDRPTLIALHHPPFDTGIPWLTEDPDALWVNRLREIVEERRNIVAMVSGHVHRTIVTGWSGIPVMVCPSTAPQVALSLAPIDPDKPDDRPMIVADPPGFALHHWDGRRLASHFDTAEDHETLARYTPKLQSLVRMLVREKEGSTLLDLG